MDRNKCSNLLKELRNQLLDAEPDTELVSGLVKRTRQCDDFYNFAKTRGEIESMFYKRLVFSV